MPDVDLKYVGQKIIICRQGTIPFIMNTYIKETQQ